MTVRDAGLIEHRLQRSLPIAGCAIDLRFASPEEMALADLRHGRQRVQDKLGQGNVNRCPGFGGVEEQLVNGDAAPLQRHRVSYAQATVTQQQCKRPDACKGEESYFLMSPPYWCRLGKSGTQYQVKAWIWYRFQATVVVNLVVVLAPFVHHA